MRARRERGEEQELQLVFKRMNGTRKAGVVIDDDARD